MVSLGVAIALAIFAVGEAQPTLPIVESISELIQGLMNTGPCPVTVPSCSFVVPQVSAVSWSLHLDCLTTGAGT